MTFKNISEKAVLNAAGRLIDPGVQITMPVEYYAEQKNFVDGYVTKKLAKIGGIEEYEDFLKNGPKKPEPKVDLMEEVRQEEKAKEAEKKTPAPKATPKAKAEPKAEPKVEPKAEEPKVEAKSEEAPVEEAPVKKPTRRRAKKATTAKAE